MFVILQAIYKLLSKILTTQHQFCYNANYKKKYAGKINYYIDS